MKPQGVLLGSVESQLSEFPSSNGRVDEMSAEEGGQLSSNTVSLQDQALSILKDRGKLMKGGIALIVLGVLLWFGPRALISGVVWMTAKTRDEALWLACVVQFVLVVMWSVLCIPFPSSVEILSGFLLGFYWGSVVNIAALFTTASVSFFLGRRYLRSSMSRWLTANAPRLERTFRVIERKGLSFLILFRLLAIPFWARNYGPAALLDCAYSDFAISVIIGTCPFGILYAFIGEKSREISEEISGKKNSGSHLAEIIIICVCLSATLYVSFVAVKTFQSAEAEEQQTTEVQTNTIELQTTKPSAI